MTKITTQLLSIAHAYDSGVKSANEQVTGYHFIGASPEAELRGYKRGTIEYSSFLNAFLDHLPRPIRTIDGIIV
jgi:hypothetical protein